MEISQKTTIEITMFREDIFEVIQKHFDQEGIKITKNAEIPAGSYVFIGEKIEALDSSESALDFVNQSIFLTRTRNTLVGYINKTELKTLKDLLETETRTIKKTMGSFGQKSHTILIEALTKKGIKANYPIFDFDI